MPETQGTFETVAQMSLKHLPNEAKLVLQRQQSDIIGKKIQFGLPTTFVSPDNGETVWNRGPSIQLEQLPELIKILTDAYKKYSECKSKDVGKYADVVYSKF